MKNPYIFTNVGKGLRGNMWMVTVIALFLTLFAITGINFFYRSKKYSTALITKDIKLLVDTFKKIDEKCKIIDFDYQKNYIDFLNNVSFVGSEVGPMNLSYPDKWEGPYLRDNPTLQGIVYQIVRTKKGYFITPGEGVMLPNGKVIGKDILFDENADIEAMMKDENALFYKGEALAAPLSIGGGAWQKETLESVLVPNGDLAKQEERRPAHVRMAALNLR